MTLQQGPQRVGGEMDREQHQQAEPLWLVVLAWGIALLIASGLFIWRDAVAALIEQVVAVANMVPKP